MPVAEPVRKLRSSYKSGNTFTDLAHNLPSYQHIHVHGWIYLLRYNKEIIERLTELDRITEELQITRQQLR